MFSNDTFALINFAKCNISFTVELNLSPNNFYKIKINILNDLHRSFKYIK